MGEMAIMGKEGDVKKIWNPENEVEIEDARASFDRLKKQGYTAFRVKRDGEKGGKMDEFDPDAGKVIMIPKIQGG